MELTPLKVNLDLCYLIKIQEINSSQINTKGIQCQTGELVLKKKTGPYTFFISCNICVFQISTQMKISFAVSLLFGAFFLMCKFSIGFTVSACEHAFTEQGILRETMLPCRLLTERVPNLFQRL